MRPLYICDIDGTIADLTHRLHFISFNASMHGFEKDFSPDWDSFHEHCGKDIPIEPVIHTIRNLLSTNDVWFFTGRMETVRKKTELWIQTFVTGPMDLVVEMRKDKDYRSDVEIKQEMLDNMLIIDRNRLIAVFDDRQRVVEMWRKNGIQCFQVKDGDY